MRVVISGSRDITNPEIVEWAVEDSGFQVTTVISGCAKGVDTLAMLWAEVNSIPIDAFEPDWTNLTHPEGLIKTNKWGQKYDARAGLRRNELMAVHADALIAIWDGESSGTKHMIKMAKKRELPIYVYRTDIATKSGHIKYETKEQFYRRLATTARDVEFPYQPPELDSTQQLIEAAKTPKGGWTRAQLAEWGIPWPPPKGWKKLVIVK